MEDNWVRSDCATVEGFPQLLWETLQRLGYTEPPMYYGREYEEGGMLKCEVHLHVPQHTSSPQFRSWCVTAFGRELSDTCQIAARQALMHYCQVFEEDIDRTPARFFPVANQTTPTWCRKIEDLEKIGRQLPESTMTATVRYLHALDSLYEDQNKELRKWVANTKKAKEKARSLILEQHMLVARLTAMEKKKEEYLQQLRQARDELWYEKNAQKTNKKKKKTRAHDMPAYDPENPLLNYVESEESDADNFTNIKTTKNAMTAESSQIPPGLGVDDGHDDDLNVL